MYPNSRQLRMKTFSCHGDGFSASQRSWENIPCYLASVSSAHVHARVQCRHVTCQIDLLRVRMSFLEMSMYGCKLNLKTV